MDTMLLEDKETEYPSAAKADGASEINRNKASKSDKARFRKVCFIVFTPFYNERGRQGRPPLSTVSTYSCPPYSP